MPVGLWALQSRRRLGGVSNARAGGSKAVRIDPDGAAAKCGPSYLAGGVSDNAQRCGACLYQRIVSDFRRVRSGRDVVVQDLLAGVTRVAVPDGRKAI